jgi:hypothetical protein
MLAILHLLVMFVADIFKSRRRVEAENLFLRHQLNIALRQAPPSLRLLGSDRALLVWMTRLWPSLIGAAQVVQPATILRWHRAGWKAFWYRAAKLERRPKRLHSGCWIKWAAPIGCIKKPLHKGFRCRVERNLFTGTRTESAASEIEFRRLTPRAARLGR